MRSLSFLAIAALTPSALAACGVSWNHTAPDIDDDWTVYPIAVNNFTFPRHIITDKDDNLLLIDRGVGVVQVKLKENGDCVEVDSIKTILEKTDLNHGIALSGDGKQLFASTPKDVFVWDYDGESLKEQRNIVTNMDRTGFSTKTLYIPESDDNYLIVSAGSMENNDLRCLEPISCAIKYFDIGNLPNTPYDFAKDGEILGWGLRNSVGVAEAKDGSIWSVENSVDDLMRNGKDVHDENPAEELNYHGKIASNTNAQKGKNFGFPNCYTAWDVEEIPDNGKLKTGSQFAADTNKTFTDDTCNDNYEPPRLALEAHTAPLDIKFYKPSDCKKAEEAGGLGCTVENAAFVAFHGSWNTDNPVGYSVGYIPFKGTGNVEPEATEEESQTAVRNILVAPDLGRCPDDCFRPTGITFNSKGQMFVTSDSKKSLVFVSHNGGAVPEAGKSNSGKKDEKEKGENSAGTLGASIWGAMAAVGVAVAFSGF
ncbi:soluble quino protein glucose dehydrogenase [Ascobolus immersus RN42]|uniref:Soluble quino protein glucose dehydrogenase n=1 Tax=Ascobolus immersus RN42 TaxID=1160509 RepID=A0A3N4INT7_ASCIM|nr:soluble quino protein glucose dehydrogenase [Ascobolus immersus RN42]